MNVQTNEATRIACRYALSDSTGVAGLTDVVVNIWKPDWTLLVTDGACSEGADGAYYYDIAADALSVAGAYYYRFSTADGTVDAQQLASVLYVGAAGVDNLDAAVSTGIGSSTPGFGIGTFSVLKPNGDADTDATASYVVIGGGSSGDGIYTSGNTTPVSLTNVAGVFTLPSWAWGTKVRVTCDALGTGWQPKSFVVPRLSTYEVENM